MANSSMLQYIKSPSLTHFLLKRNVGEHNVRFCQLTRNNDHGGSAGLSLQIRQSVIAPSLKIRAPHASGDDLNGDPITNEMELPNLVKLSFLDAKLEVDLKDLLPILSDKIQNAYFRYWRIVEVLKSLERLCTREEVDIAYVDTVLGATESVICPLMDDICSTLFTMANDKADEQKDSHSPKQPGEGGRTTLKEILIRLTGPLKNSAECVKEKVTSLMKFNDDNTGPQDCFHELFSSITKFNENLASVYYEEVQNYTLDGYFKLEGEPITFDRNKSKLLGKNMLEALNNMLPSKTRSIVGIAGQLGYSLMEYMDILLMLKKLK